MIKHNQVLAAMATGETFSLEFVTLNKKQHTGGRVRTLTGATKYNVVNKNTTAVASLTANRPAKAPNHSAHSTINIRCADSSIIKVHTRLILKYNNEEVIL